MINIQTVYEDIITELGQDAYVEAEVFELDMAKCLRMVRQAMGVYNRYSPYSGNQWVTIQNQKYIFSVEEAPQWISSCTPTGNNVVTIGSIFGGRGQQNFDGLSKYPGVDSTSFIWRFDSPILYCQYDGEVEVKGVFNHAVTVTATSEVIFASILAGTSLTVAGLTYTAYPTTETTTPAQLATAFAAGVLNPSVGSGSMAVADGEVVDAWRRTLVGTTHVAYLSTTTTVAPKAGAIVSLTYTSSTLNDTDYLFYELLKAKMMKSLGRNRRAFTLNDLPIASDASELVSEGQTLEESTMTMIHEQSKGFLAWG